MATKKSISVSRFTPKHVSSDHPAVTADLIIEVERMELLSRINSRDDQYDSAEHIAEFYRLIGLNLAQSQLRMSF